MKKSDVDLGQLSMEKLIAHDIPRRLKSDELADIPLSEAIPTLPSKTLQFFDLRLQGTLIKKGQLVEVDPKLESPTLPPKIENWLRGTETDLVVTSQRAARHLYAEQDGSTSEGLLAVSKADLNGNRALAIMKLPHEEGLQIHTKEVNGKNTLEITVLGDLTLTQHTRVFKAGLFWMEADKVVGLVSDDQTGESYDIAGFFLSNFLGFRRQQLPSVTTKSFKRIVEKYVSEKVTDDNEKLEYFNALYVELRSNAPKIDPSDFIQKHFKPEHQQPLFNTLKESGVTSAAFEKDTSQITNNGTRGRLKTTGGLTIFGDSEAMSRIQSQSINGKTAIVIFDSVSDVL